MNLLIGVVCFFTAGVVAASLVRDLMRAAYVRGRKDADAWWLRTIEDVGEERERIWKEEQEQDRAENV